MSEEINVLQRTQVINVEMSSGAVSIINAGPPGPGGPQGTSTGTIILPGTGPPLPSDGAVGNYWLDQTNDVLYGPKGTVTPVWPVAVYGAETPPALIGENRQTTNPVFSLTMLPVNVNLPAARRVAVDLHIQPVIQAGATYTFDLRVDTTEVGRFAYPLTAGTKFVHGRIYIPTNLMPSGQHTLSLYPRRTVGTGNCTFQATPTVPAYLAVYKA